MKQAGILLLVLALSSCSSATSISGPGDDGGPCGDATSEPDAAPVHDADATPVVDADVDADVDAPMDADAPVDADVPPDEPPVACWTIASAAGQIALIEVDMAMGTWTEIGRYGEGDDGFSGTEGLAYQDGAVIFGGVPDSILYRVDLRTGEVTTSLPMSLRGGIGGDEDELVSMLGELLFFPDLKPSRR